jgi:hypothetical protein
MRGWSDNEHELRADEGWSGDEGGDAGGCRDGVEASRGLRDGQGDGAATT